MTINIAIISYTIAALAFLLLSVLLLTSWRKRLHGTALTLACVLSAAWAGTLAWQASRGVQLSGLGEVLEILRNAAWTGFLLTILLPYQRRRNLAGMHVSMTTLTVGVLYLAYLAATLYGWIFAGHPVQAMLGSGLGYAGQVGMALIGVLLVEQLYRNTPSKDRWAIKFACLGIGGVFAYDFYLYSDALLFRVIDAEIWAARGLVDALAVPLLAISAARNPQWSLGISVSRKLVFHTTALFGASLYLLAMAAAGYYLRYFGGTWGSVMQAVFLFGALFLLAAVLASGSLRSRLRVFISKNFYNYRYDYREEWLRFTRTLSEQQPELGPRVIHAIAELVESPGGALWVRRDDGRYALSACLNLTPEGESVALDEAMHTLLDQRQWVIDLEEWRAQPQKYDDMDIPSWLDALARAWLVVPLNLQGTLYGFVVLLKPRSQIQLNWEIIDVLKIAGTQAASHLGQQESANALMVARQFEAISRMSTFMVHDLKNLIFQLSLLLSNAEKHKNNPAFQQDMQETLEHAVKKMQLLLHKLSSGDAMEGVRSFELGELLHQAVAMKSTSEPRPVLEPVEGQALVTANRERLERVIGHLIQNAIEASARDGKVTVRLTIAGEQATIHVSDNGCGMSQDFVRERLFKPFETTKSAGMGVGVFESREYAHELGGRLEVESVLGQGTIFRMILPLTPGAPADRQAQQHEENA